MQVCKYMHVHINTHLICKYFSHLKIHTFAQDTYANIQAHMYIRRWKTHPQLYACANTHNACMSDLVYKGSHWKRPVCPGPTVTS